MIFYIFDHSEYKIQILQIEKISDVKPFSDTLNDYINWFVFIHTSLYDWVYLMEWTILRVDNSDNDIEIHFETKHEGHKTLGFRDKQTNNILYIPFPNYMSYYHLEQILSLFLPNIEYEYYIIHNDNYYKPKCNSVFIPASCKECVFDESIYPIVITMQCEIIKK